MKYMGGKNRIAKYLLPIMLWEKKPNQYYVEPFVGGCNIIDKVGGLRIGNDKNKYLIAMWKGLQENRERPNDIPKDLYDVARDVYNGREVGFNHKMYLDDFMIGWIGWMASFNGRFFDGGYSGKASERNYVDEQIRNTEKQIENIKDVEFFNCDYKDLVIPKNSVVYCDIPYKSTKQYATSKDFNYDEFWEWCRMTTRQGNKMFISEYKAPDDFKCIWQKEVTNAMNTIKTYKPIEKLFTFNLNN